LALDRPGKALSPLEEAVALNPDFTKAHYQLGNALARLGRPEEAAHERALSVQIQARERAEYARKLNSTAKDR